jgi:hypothetical protein
MASFGGVTVDILRGVPTPLRERVVFWQLTGIDGVGAQLTGKGNDGSELILMRFGSNATVNSWWASINAKLGQLITITDDFGDSYTNVLVQFVGVLEKSAAAWSAGSFSDQLGVLRTQVVIT